MSTLMKKRMALLITASTPEAAYAPWMMAATAAAMGYECRLFYAFGGLDLLRSGLQADAAEQLASMPDPASLRAICLEQGVELAACSASLMARGMSEADLLPGVTLAGMASWLAFASGAEIQLSFN
ncbi:MAG: DsrE/DsrF/DrsH-like family protein [Pseudomonadota bacterium]